MTELLTVIPVKTRSPNKFLGARARMVANKHERSTAAMWLKQWTRRLVIPSSGPIRIELTRVSQGKLDDDNLRMALKHVRDGVSDFLGFADDSNLRLQWVYDQAHGSAAVQLRITFPKE